jgi:hypothetical protein
MPSVPVNPNMIVYPSGVLLAICLAATVPPAPATLVDNNLLAKCVGEPIGDDPRDDAGAAARRKGIDNRDRPRRIDLRFRDPRDGRQYGSTGGQTQKSAA